MDDEEHAALIHCLADNPGAEALIPGKRYHYYTCSTVARQGKAGCKGARSRWTGSIIWWRIIWSIGCSTRTACRTRSPRISTVARNGTAAAGTQANELIKRAAEAEQRLKRLYDAIESGVADLADPSPKEQIEELKATCDHLRAFAQRVAVAEREVRIMGSHNELLRLLTSSNGVETAANGVRIYVPGWRMGWDSNPRDGCPPAGFQDRCLQPLGHPSRRAIANVRRAVGFCPKSDQPASARSGNASKQHQKNNLIT